MFANKARKLVEMELEKRMEECEVLQESTQVVRSILLWILAQGQTSADMTEKHVDSRRDESNNEDTYEQQLRLCDERLEVDDPSDDFATDFTTCSGPSLKPCTRLAPMASTLCKDLSATEIHTRFLMTTVKALALISMA